jgi:hypothetical protein
VRELLSASALLCALAQGAAAQSGPPGPEVEGGEVCDAARATEIAFRRHAPGHEAETGVTIHISYEASAGWRAVVQGPAGARTVQDETCRVVARAAGVIAALMVREAARGVMPVLAGAPRFETALPAPAPEPEIEPDADRAMSASHRWTGVRLAAGFAAGFADRMAPSAGVALVRGIARHPVELELGARHSRAGVVDDADNAWNRNLPAARAALCARARKLLGCAGAEGGFVTLSGSLPGDGRLRGRAAWVAPTADMGLTLWHGKELSVYARTTLAYALVRPAFLSLDDELIHSASRLSGRIALGLAYELW